MTPEKLKEYLFQKEIITKYRPLGRRIRSFRKAYKLKTWEAADLMSIPAYYLTAIETGGTKYVSEEKANTICNTFAMLLKDTQIPFPNECLEGQLLSEWERTAIFTTLRVCKGNREKTAKMLGIPERTLYRKLKQYQIK
jgi:transcriptional regulator with XRE-family HTH domain